MQKTLLLVFALGLIGCASKKDIFPDDMQTMGQIYDQHFAEMGTGAATLHDVRQRAGGNLTPVGYHGAYDYTRHAHDELAARFPRLPNPDILMYVDPHLTAGGQPVPGYTTSFPLYEKVEYALPGEAPPAAVVYPPVLSAPTQGPAQGILPIRFDGIP